MNLKSPLNFIFRPSLLKKLDRELLLNQPMIWASRVHFVAYYGLLVNLLLMLIFVSNVPSKQIDEFVRYFPSLLIVFEVSAFFFWIFKQSIFDIDKQHGQINAFYKRSILEMAVYALCFFIIFSPSFIVPTAVVYKVGHEVGIDANTNCGEDFTGVLQATFSSSGNKGKASDICSDIRTIVSGKKDVLRYLPHDIYLMITLLLVSLICLPAFIMQKYSKWTTIAWLGLYVTVLSALVLAVLILFESRSFRLIKNSFGTYELDNGNGDICLVVLTVSAISFLLFMKVFKNSKHNLYPVIGFGVFMISFQVFFWFLSLVDSEKSVYEELDFMIGVLILFFISFPLYQKVLIENLSMPKIK